MAESKEAVRALRDLPPFDPGDEFDAMADWFRRRVADMALEAQEAAIYRGLPVHRQVECFMAGVLTGYIGTLFAFIHPNGRDALMESVADYLPHARLNAEDLIAEAARPQEKSE